MNRKIMSNVSEMVLYIFVSILFIVCAIGTGTGAGMIIMAAVGKASFVEDAPVVFWTIWVICLCSYVGITALEKNKVYGKLLLEKQVGILMLISLILFLVSTIWMFLAEELGIGIIISKDFMDLFEVYILGPMMFNLLITVSPWLRIL